MKKVIKIGHVNFTQSDISEFLFTDHVGVMAVIIPNDVLSKAKAKNDLATYFSWELSIINQLNFESEIVREIVTKEIIVRGVTRSKKFMSGLINENGYLFSYMPCVTKLTYYKNY